MYIEYSISRNFRIELILLKIYQYSVKQVFTSPNDTRNNNNVNNIY